MFSDYLNSAKTILSCKQVQFPEEQLTSAVAHMAQSVLGAFSVLDQSLDYKTVVYLKLLVQHVLILKMLVSCVLVRSRGQHI